MHQKLFVFLVSCTFSLSIHAKISNMIVFGDSLSDGGNFPESPAEFWNPMAPKTIVNSIAQFYVPFSNPVDTKSDNSESFPWPTLDDHYLSAQTKINQHSEKRKYRSISWPQFFLSLAKSKKQIISEIISPSDLLNTVTLPNTISLNYAWGYATSGDQCVNPYYQKINNCDAKSIAHVKNNYVKNPNQTNYAAIQIPGLIQQVRLFTKDIQSKKIIVDSNTLYTFWIGGNDLIIANNALKNNKNPLLVIKFALGNTGTNLLKSIVMLLHALPENKRPGKIYVFELFNPQLTPAFYTLKIAKFGNFLVRCSNFWLRWDMRMFNLFFKTKIMIIPSYHWYQADSKNDYFKQHKGEDCQTIIGNYDNPTRISPSNCGGFMFWNAVHPSSAMNAMLAKRLYTLINSSY